MKQLFIAITLLLASAGIFAQHSIQSMVFDNENSLALELATVRLLNTTDSSLVQGCRTNMNGEFMLSKIKPGSYRLIVSMVGYKDYVQLVKMESKNIILKNIHMAQSEHKLGEVEVKGTAAQLVVKGDTTEYNATAFKTAQNAVVEDLLKKMPGVEVSSDGKITVNGQEIKKIRVDGKKFFDGDIEMATKNIPADMIEKVQVYDNKSDMAKLTGFEDNDTERIINLTTKANRKHGVFGNIVGGAGSDLGNDKNDFRYDGNAFVNIMSNDIQTAITGGANNTNTSRSGRSRGGMGNPSGGITSTQNIGINNNSVMNPKLTLGGDASFNHSQNISTTQNEKNSYLKGSTYTDNSNRSAEAGNSSANLRLEMEWKPDSLNTLLVQPNLSYNRTDNDNSNSFSYYTDSVLTSIGNSKSYGNGNSLSAGMNMIYNRKFRSKKGRNMTINLQGNLSQSDNQSWNISNRIALGTSTDINQYIKNKSNSYNTSIRISYVEPLWNVRNLLEAAVGGRITNNSSEKNQYEKDPTGDFRVNDSIYKRNDSLSNTFKNRFYNESFEINYRYVTQNYNLMLGVKAEPSQTTYNRAYSNGMNRDTTYGVFNFSPTARLQYNFTKKKFLRFDYRGRTSQPSISQMQPVINNSNLMNEVVGNPNLNPEFTHNIRMFYSSFNDVTFSSLNLMLNAELTKDALVSNSIFDHTGKQYSQTINAPEMPYNLSSNIMFNTPLIQKRLHFNTRTSFNLSKRIGYSKSNVTDIDIHALPLGDLSKTNQYGGSEGISLTFTSDMIELGSSGNLRYTNTTNNLQNTHRETYDWTVSGNFVAHLPYTFNVASDINFATMQGYAGFDQNQLIWNASIDKSFLNNKGVVALKVYDILHRRLNVSQSIGDNYIQFSRFNTLTSYFILSFSYRINEFKGSERSGKRDGFRRYGGDGGGGGRRGGGGFDGPPAF